MKKTIAILTFLFLSLSMGQSFAWDSHVDLMNHTNYEVYWRVNQKTYVVPAGSSTAIYFPDGKANIAAYHDPLLTNELCKTQCWDEGGDYLCYTLNHFCHASDGDAVYLEPWKAKA